MNISSRSLKIFVRANLVRMRFQRCSLRVKLKLFQACCICFYDTALWSNFTVTAISKFKSWYHKCLKHFGLRYLKYSSVTNMMLELELPSFDTFIHNYTVSFSRCMSLVTTYWSNVFGKIHCVCYMFYSSTCLSFYLFVCACWCLSMDLVSEINTLTDWLIWDD